MNCFGIQRQASSDPRRIRVCAGHHEHVLDLVSAARATFNFRYRASAATMMLRPCRDPASCELDRVGPAVTLERGGGSSDHDARAELLGRHERAAGETLAGNAVGEAEVILDPGAGTAEHVERIVRGWRRVDRIAEAQETVRRHKSRALHVY